MKWFVFILLIPFIIPKVDLDTNTIPITTLEQDDEICISSDEKALMIAINNYRKRKGLKPIPFSNAMTIVAQKHVKELNDELKNLTHSWVDCKYKNSNPKSYRCMWDKPKELTNYPSNGYECAFGKWGGTFTPQEVLNNWKKSPGHNNIIINKKIWSKTDWNAMGVAIYGNYAVLWLGEDVDELGEPDVCD